MNSSHKIMLENSIFARAAQLREVVYGRAGRLVSSSKDNCLHALLNLYNAFFYRENWENFCAQEKELQGLENFKSYPARTPVFLNKEYNFELIMGGRNA